MSMINIRRDVQDSFYRYKMPKLQSKIEGKGNGIKTVIPNMSDIAKALARPPLYTTKYFGFELGAQVIVAADADRYIVNGAHDASKLQDVLDGFIEKFVLCRACKNPETELVVTVKSGDIIRDCKACGKQTPVDLRHKLANVIVRNPPEKKKKSKSGKKASKKADSEEDGEDEDGEIAAGSDDELTRSIQLAAAAMPTANGDEKWSVDTSEAAVKARVANLADGVDKLVMGDEDDDDQEGGGGAGESNYDVLGSWIEENKGTCSDVDIYKKATELEIEAKHKTLAVVVQCLFDGGILKQIPKHAALLKKLKADNERAEKAMLGGLERVIGQLHPDLLPGTSKILMTMYDNDLLTEEVVDKWGGKASKKYVDRETSKKIRKAAEPFLQWLQEAESDEESDEDEDEDDDDE